MTLKLFTIESVSKSWIDGELITENFEFYESGEIRFNNEVVGGESTVVDLANPHEYLMSFFKRAFNWDLDFFLVERATTTKYAISCISNSESLDEYLVFEYLIDFLDMLISTDYLEDNPDYEDWAHHSFDEQREVKLEIGAVLDRMLFINEEQIIILPDDDGLVELVTIDDLEQAKQNPIFGIEHQNFSCSLSAISPLEYLGQMSFGELPIYFKLHGTTPECLWRFFYSKLPSLFSQQDAWELNRSLNQSIALIQLQDASNERVLGETLEFRYTGSEIQIQGHLPSRMLGIIQLMLAFDETARWYLNDTATKLTAKQFSDPSAEFCVSKVHSGLDYFWEEQSVQNELLSQSEGIRFTGDLLSVIVSKLTGHSFRTEAQSSDAKLNDLVRTRLAFSDLSELGFSFDANVFDITIS
jgi:hypothetical protein